MVKQNFSMHGSEAPWNSRFHMTNFDMMHKSNVTKIHQMHHAVLRY